MDSLDEKIAEIKRLTAELERQSASAKKRLADKKRTVGFWETWTKACEDGLVAKVFGVVRRYHNFVLVSREQTSTFMMDLLERCYNAYDDFDPDRSEFTTWACWHARSLADSIIKSGSVKDTGAVGRGMSWPYNRNEVLFVDMLPEDDEDATEDELPVLAVNDMPADVQIWISDECKHREVRIVIESVWQHCEMRNKHGLAYETPTPLALARITKLTSIEIRQILDDLGTRFIERFGNESLDTI